MPNQSEHKESRTKEKNLLIKIADILLERKLISMEERLRFREYVDEDRDELP